MAVTEVYEALRRLTLAARTSGGTAGPDAELMSACEQAERVLSTPPSGDREAVLEDAAKAVCEFCRAGDPLYCYPQPDGILLHNYNDHAFRCKAAAIRALKHKDAKS